MEKPRPQVVKVHPSGSPVCSLCGHTRLMHRDDGTPCGAASCTCKKFQR